MSLLLLLRSNQGAGATVAPVGRVRRSRLPESFWTIDGYPVDMAVNWQASEQANFGFNQFRGQISPRSAHALPWTVGVDSIIKGVTHDGVVLFEGRLSAPLTIDAADTVPIAGQGYAYDASKRADRFPVLVTAPEAWQVANVLPFDWPQIASDQPTITAGKSSSAFGESTKTLQANNAILLEGTNVEDMSMVFWARGARVSKFAAYFKDVAGAKTTVYGAHGPDIFDRPVVLYEVDTVGGPHQATFEVPVDQAFDALVVRYRWTTASPAPIMDLVNPHLWCDTEEFTIRAQDVVRGIGRHMGWDTSGVQDVGIAVFPSFDWAGTAQGALSEAAGPDDLVWGLFDNPGDGERLTLREWGDREVVVSDMTGASWANLQRMQRINRVTTQYLDALGMVRTTTLDADPDPTPGRINEAQVTLGGLVPVDTTSNTPEVLTAKALAALSVQRFAGDVVTGSVFIDGRNAPYEVRVGDRVRIADYSRLDGAVTDRVASVTRSAGGVAITLEPAVLGGAALSGRQGGAAPGTLLRPTNFPVYLPPASPGSTTPQTDTDYVGAWGPGGPPSFP